jgi:glucokinase
MIQKTWAIGVDLGGTKIQVAQVDASGHIQERLRTSTDPKESPSVILSEIISAIEELRSHMKGSPPAGVGAGVAGQIDPHSGTVRFAPNLGWRDVPFGVELNERCPGSNLG